MKIKERTPVRFRCVVGGCPAVFEISDSKFLIVGTKIGKDSIKKYGLEGRIGPKETIIEIPCEVLGEIFSK